MKTVLALILFVGSASTALANRDGYVASQYTCSELQSILAEEGQITLIRRFGSLTYYADREVCQRGTDMVAVASKVKTKDTRRCFIGYRCNFIGGADVSQELEH